MGDDRTGVLRRIALNVTDSDTVSLDGMRKREGLVEIVVDATGTPKNPC